MSSFARIKALREQRAGFITQAGEILTAAGDRDLNADERSRFEALHADGDKLKAQIETLERQSDAEAELRAGAGRMAATAPAETRRATSADPVERAEQEKRAFKTFIAYGVGQMTPEERAILAPYAFNVRELPADEQRSVEEQRVLSGGAGATGGYTIPIGFQAALEAALKFYGGMRKSRATVVKTEQGNDLHWPSVNDTGNTGRLLAESTGVTDTDPTFGEVVLKAYKYSSDQVKLPFELLQDSAFDVLTFLADALGQRIGRIQNQHQTTGTGTGQPKGIVPAAFLGTTGIVGQTTSVIYDDLVNLIHSVDVLYRQMGEFMLNDLSVAKIRLLKDSTGQPLWQPGITAGLQPGIPDRILGFPFTVNNDVPVMAANAKSILFGDFSKYLIRDVGQIRVVRLNELYAASDQVGIVAFARMDANLLDAGTHPVKYYANSAT